LPIADSGAQEMILVLLFFLFLFLLQVDSFYQPSLQQSKVFHSIRKPFLMTGLQLKPLYFSKNHETCSSIFLHDSLSNPIYLYRKHKAPTFSSSPAIHRVSGLSSSLSPSCLSATTTSSSSSSSSSSDNDSPSSSSSSSPSFISSFFSQFSIPINYFEANRDPEFVEYYNQDYDKIQEWRKKKFKKYELYAIDEHEKELTHHVQLYSLWHEKVKEIWEKERIFFPYRVKFKKFLFYCMILVHLIFLCFHKFLLFLRIAYFYYYFKSLFPVVLVSARSKARWSAISKRWKEFWKTIPWIRKKIEFLDKIHDQLEKDLTIYLQQLEEQRKKENSAFTASDNSDK
jgi:hypothetical protein